MDAVKYFKEKTRMLNSLGRKSGKCDGASCLNCPLAYMNNGKGLSCSDFEAEYPEEAVAIVEKWAAEHQQKTMFQDFLEKYPNASLTSYGTPHICPYELGYEGKEPVICFTRRCIDCWNRPIEG